MRVFDCTMFFDEHLIADVRLQENARWVDETHITEADRTFRNERKDYRFNSLQDRQVVYHRQAAALLFRSGFWSYNLRAVVGESPKLSLVQRGNAA